MEANKIQHDVAYIYVMIVYTLVLNTRNIFKSTRKRKSRLNNLCPQIDLQIGLFLHFCKVCLSFAPTVREYQISKFFDNKSAAAENILKHFISGYFTKWVLVYFESFWVQGRFFPSNGIAHYWTILFLRFLALFIKTGTLSFIKKI